MNSGISFFITLALMISGVFFGKAYTAGRELHVAKSGHDTATGSVDAPFLTIGRAAREATVRGARRVGGTAAAGAGGCACMRVCAEAAAGRRYGGGRAGIDSLRGATAAAGDCAGAGAGSACADPGRGNLCAGCRLRDVGAGGVESADEGADDVYCGAPPIDDAQGRPDGSFGGRAGGADRPTGGSAGAAES